jgi:hypothetical protein
MAWPGPISAALYVALNSGSQNNSTRWKEAEKLLHHAISDARSFHAMAEKNLSCQLDLLLVYERFNSSREMILYPVNTLRNYARLQARTPLIGLFDADMLTSLTLFYDLLKPDALKRWENCTVDL